MHITQPPSRAQGRFLKHRDSPLEAPSLLPPGCGEGWCWSEVDPSVSSQPGRAPAPQPLHCAAWDGTQQERCLSIPFPSAFTLPSLPLPVPCSVSLTLPGDNKLQLKNCLLDWLEIKRTSSVVLCLLKD